jgi:hypothetical protein
MRALAMIELAHDPSEICNGSAMTSRKTKSIHPAGLRAALRDTLAFLPGTALGSR